jgi:hypothetical protein
LWELGGKIRPGTGRESGLSALAVIQNLKYKMVMFITAAVLNYDQISIIRKSTAFKNTPNSVIKNLIGVEYFVG